MDQNKPNVAASLMTIHYVITRALSVSIANATRFIDNWNMNKPLLEGYRNYVLSLMSVLNGHHLTEDELGFPFFKDVLPAMPFDRLTLEHEEITKIIRQITTIAESFSEHDHAAEKFRNLIELLKKLIDIWHPHIKTEEEFVNPETLEKLLTVEQHLELIKKFGEHSMKNSGPDYLVMPFIYYNLPAEIRVNIEKAWPVEVTGNLIPVVWKDKWVSMSPFLLT